MDYAALIAFLADLSDNNNRTWFNEHRATYETLRGQFTGLVDEVIAGIAPVDPTVAIVSARDCLFRINRDVRFSPDKSPYNTHFSASICAQGRNSGLPAYYFHIAESGSLLVAGGLYMPDPAQLALIRRHIAEHPERLERVLTDAAFAANFGTIDGERLKRPPQGFDAQAPHIEMIKLKSFIATCEPQGWLERGEALPGEIAATFRAMFPLIAWLREALAGWESSR